MDNNNNKDEKVDFSHLNQLFGDLLNIKSVNEEEYASDFIGDASPRTSRFNRSKALNYSFDFPTIVENHMTWYDSHIYPGE